MFQAKIGRVLKGGRNFNRPALVTRRRNDVLTLRPINKTGQIVFGAFGWMLAFGVSVFVVYQTHVDNPANLNDRYIEQVMARLSTALEFLQDHVNDIPSLTFVERNTQRMGELNAILKTSGGLTLLEGPSGSGKTTTIQYALVQSGRPGVYFSLRDNASGRSPLATFAQAFGVQELPQDKWSDSLDIIRMALEQLQARNKRDHQGAMPPVLVIDDVQQLLKPAAATADDEDAGRKILEWCLGRAAHQELTVLFISSERVQQSMQALSGYAARLRVPDGFDYIDSHMLKASLREIKGALAFTDEEADRVISVLGTHMSDIRQLQRRRVEQTVSCDTALEGLLMEEIRFLNKQLRPTSDDSLSDPSLTYGIVGKTVCDKLLAESDEGLCVSDVWEAIEASLLSTNNKACKVTVDEFEAIVDGLVRKHVLRRYYKPNSGDEYLAFHRPVLRMAYQRLTQSKAFVQYWKPRSVAMSYASSASFASSTSSIFAWFVPRGK